MRNLEEYDLLAALHLYPVSSGSRRLPLETEYLVVFCLLCMSINLVVKVHCGNSSERKPLANGKGVTAMLGLKEAIGKIASLRTETTYKAGYLDECAK